MRRSAWLIATFVALMPASAAFCGELASAELRGLQIMQESERRDSGWNDATSHMTMILTNPHGDTRERAMRSQSLEVADDGDKRLIVFEFPPDVRGTGFLSFSHKVEEDDQWLYLPALKRVKRIASRSKSESFMGSEFAYEDIGGQEIEKYTYRWLRDEQLEGTPCFVIESFPVDPRTSGYSRRISWIDQERYIVHRIDYYDRDNELLKTLHFREYHQYLDRYWRAGTMEMVNHQNDKQTSIVWRSYEFGTGLTDSDFTINSLKRVR